MKAHYYTLQQDHYDDVEEDSDDYDDDHPDRPIPRRCWSPITHSLTPSVCVLRLCCASVSVPVPVPACLCVFLCRARESLRMPSVARRRTGFSLFPLPAFSPSVRWYFSSPPTLSRCTGALPFTIGPFVRSSLALHSAPECAPSFLSSLFFYHFFFFSSSCCLSISGSSHKCFLSFIYLSLPRSPS